MKLSKFKKIFKKYWHFIVIVLLAMVFFIGASAYNFYTQDFSDNNSYIKWASPDESANYVFAKLYGQENKITIRENYNLSVNDIMHPRSFRSDLGALKPVSFLGIILIYGKIVNFTTYKILPFLTPFFASLGIIFFYLLIKKLFGKTNALVSAFLLAVFPVYIYFSVRGMFHNVLFVVFLITGLYYSVIAVQKTKKNTKYFTFSFKTINYSGLIYASLAGIFLGLAIIARASELIWLGPLLIVLWLFNIKKLDLNKLLLIIAFLALAVTPALYYNQILYSSPYLGGYSEMNQSIINIKNASTNLITSGFKDKPIHAAEQVSKIKNSVLFFGLNPKQSLKMFYYYFIEMFPYLFYLGVLGLLVFFIRFRKIKYKHAVFILSLALVSVILIFYYGSWEFFDNPDKASHTIGNSYTRYWLPIYLGVIPFASLFIIRFSRAISLLIKKKSDEERSGFLSFITSRKFCANSIIIILVIIISFISLNFLLTGSDEGLIYLAGRQQAAKQEFNRVIKLTESNAVIITQHHDKLFFPERKVIVGLFDDKNMIGKYAEMAKLLPVYYYNFTFPEKDFNYLNDRRLKEFGLGIRDVERITNDFTLYKIFIAENKSK